MPGPGAALIGREELREVTEVIESQHLSRYGSEDDPAFKRKVRTFEKRIEQEAGVGYALGVNSGTSALYLAYLALGIGPGDEVIVPGFTFVASISAVAYTGASPVLAEVDDTFNLDPADVESKITERTKAILLVHMLGSPGRVNELKAIADKYGIALIEDAAQAFGATYQGQWAGSLGTLGIYSFNEFKTISCGDGGMVVTSDEAFYQRCFAMHDQGHSPNRSGVEVGQRPFMGLNFRMTELQGAVLLAQLGRLDHIRQHLRSNRDIVHSVLAELPGLRFRRLVDLDGDAATHLVVTFPTAQIARNVTTELGSITLDHSGWHVYANMEHLLKRRLVTGSEAWSQSTPEYTAEMLPRTNELLSRSMSFSIGVVDTNLSPFGVSMADDNDAARKKAEFARDVMARHLS